MAVADADGRPDPLLIVHGYMDSGGTPWWTRMTRRLANAGFPSDRVHVLDQGAVWTTVASPREYAERVLSACERVADAAGAVDVLAHSMGGLSARWAVERLDGAAYVDDLVTLGTPHQGTYLAYVGAATAGGRAMIPGSRFLEALNGDALAETVDYTAVWSDRDSAITPGENAALPADVFPSMRGARNVRVEASHFGLVTDADVFEAFVGRLG